MNAAGVDIHRSCSRCGAPMLYEGASEPMKNQPGYHIYSCSECDELSWLKAAVEPSPQRD